MCAFVVGSGEALGPGTAGSQDGSHTLLQAVDRVIAIVRQFNALAASLDLQRSDAL
jgi:hypothetical protein